MKTICIRYFEISHRQRVTLDLTAERLLEVIAVRESQDKCMTVTETMQQTTLASPATIHRKLTELLEAGLVAQVHEGKNRRTKFLRLTNKSKSHFAKLSEAMAQVTAKEMTNANH